MKQQIHPKLKQLQNLLKYHELLGIDSYPASADISFFLEKAPSLLAEKATIRSKIAESTPKVVDTPGTKMVTGSMEEICVEVRECRSCALCKQRILPVCGAGGEQIKLMIVGGWLALSSSPESSSVIFGTAEDTMVFRMLQAIHLSANEAFITNVIKCGIDTKVQPQKVHIDTCISYLERQIARLSPAVICTMGTVATRALLKVKQPLSQLRGKFHDYHLDDQKKIPLMPTYHPSFLLSNPEMKKPTWEDLQLVEKALQSL
ncbi:MAG: uracil-DNA glycosylase [Desulfocapsaceae bacterium]|nr:uracil-DNA glycosylase [Desulfocapsaceae bacterium]